MTTLEKEFKELILETGLTIYQYNTFKSQYSNIYKAICQSLHNISLKNVSVKNVFTLEKKDIKKATIKIGKPKTFIFCGAYLLDGRNVILLENTDTIGTYYLDDYNIFRQLKNYKIGLKVRFERHKDGINMILPHDESNNIGLFENDY